MKSRASAKVQIALALLGCEWAREAGIGYGDELLGIQRVQPHDSTTIAARPQALSIGAEKQPVDEILRAVEMVQFLTGARTVPGHILHLGGAIKAA